MRTTTSYLEYGEQKKIKIQGKYVKGLARAVEGKFPTATAEILLISDDSDETSEIRILYSENGEMCDYIFWTMNAYLKNFENLLDVVMFNYVRDANTHTGIIIIAKDSEEELVDEIMRNAEDFCSSTVKMATLEESATMYKK